MSTWTQLFSFIGGTYSCILLLSYLSWMSYLLLAILGYYILSNHYGYIPFPNRIGCNVSWNTIFPFGFFLLTYRHKLNLRGRRTRHVDERPWLNTITTSILLLCNCSNTTGMTLHAFNFYTVRDSCTGATTLSW